MDIPSSIQIFEYYANLEIPLKKEIPLPAEAKSSIGREPVGVAGLIIPWNYPLLIASWKLSACLLAGNTVILKPSSLTPLTALSLACLIKEAGLPSGVVNVVIGKGEDTGGLLCESDKVDLISFTGSNPVGKEIMQRASGNTKKLILELGGKSASIIFSDCDLEVAVNSSLCAIFLNQGQMCTAMARILVEKNIYDVFLEEFIKKTKKLKLGDSLDVSTQMGPLISEEQRKKVISFIEKAKAEGAKLLCGGKIPQDPGLKKGFFFEPTVFSDVSAQMSIFQEEIFGPVVAITYFSDLEEAETLANQTRFGLAACIWTKDLKKAEALAEKLDAGTVWINTYGMFYPQVPYGGFKQSGFGKELGKEGFLEYTRLKHVNLDTSPDKPLVNYWYGF